jgi:hypothetical protein
VVEASRDPRFLCKWAELEREALEPNPFFAPQMVLPAARHLENGDSAQLLVAESADALLFLMPVAGGIGLRGMPVPGLRSWMHDYCFLGTPLLSAHGDSTRIWTKILDELRRTRPAPLLVMQLHSADGPVAAGLFRADAQMGLGVRQSPHACRGFTHRRPELDYTREWISRKHRADLARRRRALGRKLDIKITTVDRAAADPGKAIEYFLQLEASGWKGRAGTALLRRPGHDRFFREMSEGFADDGRLMFLSLEAGTQVLAQNTALQRIARSSDRSPPFHRCAPDGNPMLRGPQRARTGALRAVLHACQQPPRPSTRRGSAGRDPTAWVNGRPSRGRQPHQARDPCQPVEVGDVMVAGQVNTT